MNREPSPQDPGRQHGDGDGHDRERQQDDQRAECAARTEQGCHGHNGQQFSERTVIEHRPSEWGRDEPAVGEDRQERPQRCGCQGDRHGNLGVHLADRSQGGDGTERQQHAHAPGEHRAAPTPPAQLGGVDLVSGEQEEHPQAEFAQDADLAARLREVERVGADEDTGHQQQHDLGHQPTRDGAGDQRCQHRRDGDPEQRGGDSSVHAPLL